MTVRHLLLLLAAALLCAQPDADARWRAFLAWLSAQPPDSKPANLIRPYRAELIRQGMSPAEAERELERLGQLGFHPARRRESALEQGLRRP